jgi:hypothetical protein
MTDRPTAEMAHATLADCVQRCSLNPTKFMSDNADAAKARIASSRASPTASPLPSPRMEQQVPTPSRSPLPYEKEEEESDVGSGGRLVREVPRASYADLNLLQQVRASLQLSDEKGTREGDSSDDDDGVDILHSDPDSIDTIAKFVRFVTPLTHSWCPVWTLHY